MDSKNYTDVLIGGRIYTLGGLEEESYLQQVASYLNEKLAVLRRQDGFLKQPEDYQNIMLCLNLADDYFKEREHAGTLAAQKEELEKETYRLKHELVSTQMKLETSRKDLETAREELKRSRISGKEEQNNETDGKKPVQG